MGTAAGLETNVPREQQVYHQIMTRRPAFRFYAYKNRNMGVTAAGGVGTLFKLLRAVSRVIFRVVPPSGQAFQCTGTE